MARHDNGVLWNDGALACALSLSLCFTDGPFDTDEGLVRVVVASTDRDAEVEI